MYDVNFRLTNARPLNKCEFRIFRPIFFDMMHCVSSLPCQFSGSFEMNTARTVNAVANALDETLCMHLYSNFTNFKFFYGIIILFLKDKENTNVDCIFLSLP